MFSRFSLIEKFTLLILVSMTAAALYLGFYVSNRLLDDLKSMYEGHVTRQVQLTARSYLLTTDYLNRDWITEHQDEFSQQLEAFLRARFQQDPRNKPLSLVVFDREGQQLGRDPQEESATSLALPPVDPALVRRVVASGLPEVTFLGNAQQSYLKSLLGSILGEPPGKILRMLIPVTSQPIADESMTGEGSLVRPGKVEGVMKIDVRPDWMLSRHQINRERIWKKVLIMFLSLYVVLFWLFYRASTTIQKQADELRNRQSLTQLGQMAGYLAHEIRNPLFVIRSSAQTLQDEFEPDDRNRIWANFIMEEVDQLNSLVGDLLGLVRKDTHDRLPTASISEALEGACNRILPQAPGITVERQLDPKCDHAGFGQDQLMQIFINLLRNTRDACPEQGSVTVSNRRRRDGTIEIQFIDDGPGIPGPVTERIFEPFFSQKEGGTGLGLAIVKRLVEANQGTIEVVSAPGQGATFILVCQAPERSEEDRQRA